MKLTVSSFSETVRVRVCSLSPFVSKWYFSRLLCEDSVALEFGIAHEVFRVVADASDVVALQLSSEAWRLRPCLVGARSAADDVSCFSGLRPTASTRFPSTRSGDL